MAAPRYTTAQSCDEYTNEKKQRDETRRVREKETMWLQEDNEGSERKGRNDIARSSEAGRASGECGPETVCRHIEEACVNSVATLLTLLLVNDLEPALF